MTAGQSPQVICDPADPPDTDYVAYYQAEMPRLVRYLMKCGADHNDAVEAAQHAFVELFGKRESVRSPLSWLRMVAFRKFLHLQTTNERPLEPCDDGPSAILHASERIELREEEQAVLAALQQLPITQRQVFALHYDQFGISEIGEVLGMTEPAVRQNLARARGKLKEVMGHSRTGELAQEPTGHRLTSVRTLPAPPPAVPMYRSIVAVGIEGAARRTTPIRGEMQRTLCRLLRRAAQEAGITDQHLEFVTGHGDGVLILVRPHDDVPKSLVLGRLMPMLIALLTEHNAAASRPELRLRLRAVVHAGEVRSDGNGFYGYDLDVAFRLLEAPKVKRALKESAWSPLVLVVSEEIFSGMVRHGYAAAGPYAPVVRVRVGQQQRRGWVHVPVPAQVRPPAAAPRLTERRHGTPGSPHAVVGRERLLI